MGEIPQPDFTGIDLILVGGLSGPEWKKHIMRMEWAANLYQATRTWNAEHEKQVSYFFKQNSAPITERGIDALGNYLNLPDPIIHEMPSAPMGLPWAPMGRTVSESEAGIEEFMTVREHDLQKE